MAENDGETDDDNDDELVYPDDDEPSTSGGPPDIDDDDADADVFANTYGKFFFFALSSAIILISFAVS